MGSIVDGFVTKPKQRLLAHALISHSQKTTPKSTWFETQVRLVQCY